MPRIVTKMLQGGDAVYYPPTGQDAGGRKTYGEPIEIKCFWMDVQEEFINAAGNVQLSRSKVYVDRDLVLGGVLVQGTLADLEFPDHPTQNVGFGIIQGRSKKPAKINQTQHIRFVYL